ncbi:MAG: hypothetical protein WA921_02150 [Ahrensia sp.]
MNQNEFNIDENIKEALADGKLWRAKEIAQGRLSIAAFDPKVMFNYGFVLLKMGDTKEAGRYLFASGRRDPEFSDAIELFLSTLNCSSRDQRLWEAMPKMLRKCGHKAKLIATSNAFIARGYSAKEIEQLAATTAKRTKGSQQAMERDTWGTQLLVFATVSTLLLSIFLGLITIVTFIFNFARGFIDG